MAISTDNNKMRLLRWEEQGEQLLPGISNEITLDLITPKLPYRVLCILSSVSRFWQEAIRTREVYDARVRAKSTETLIVHIHNDAVLALYSTSEKRCYKLPPIPWLNSDPLRSCKLIALHGKLYLFPEVLWPENVFNLQFGHASPHICMLDLATGQKEWERCASMRDARYQYGCGVAGGKIYVLGGICPDIPEPQHEGVLEGEVYDPQENNWSPIPHMTHESYHHFEVATIGEELLVYGGQFWEEAPGGNNKKEMPWRLYSLAKKEWRLVEKVRHPENCEGSKLFLVKEKVYLFASSGIYFYDFDQKSWIHQHANAFPTDGPKDSIMHNPIHVLAVNNDELVMVGWWGRPWELPIQSFHCKGFNSEKKEMVWQKINCKAYEQALKRVPCPIISSIQL